MIVCQLSVKVVMEASLVDSLAVHVSKSLLREPVLAKEGLGCLIVLLQNQKEGAAGPRYDLACRSVRTCWTAPLNSNVSSLSLCHQSVQPSLFDAHVGLNASAHGGGSRHQSSAALPAASPGPGRVRLPLR